MPSSSAPPTAPTAWRRTPARWGTPSGGSWHPAAPAAAPPTRDSRRTTSSRRSGRRPTPLPHMRRRRARPWPPPTSPVRWRCSWQRATAAPPTTAPPTTLDLSPYLSPPEEPHVASGRARGVPSGGGDNRAPAIAAATALLGAAATAVGVMRRRRLLTPV